MDLDLGSLAASLFASAFACGPVGALFGALELRGFNWRLLVGALQAGDLIAQCLDLLTIADGGSLAGATAPEWFPLTGSQ